MDSMVTRYVEELNKLLRPLPEAERVDAVEEIKSHIADSIAAGQPAAAILAGLGAPKDLAKAYLTDYHLEAFLQPSKFKSILRAIFFFASTGFISFLLVPFFVYLIIIFGALALLMPVFFVMQLFGNENVFILYNDTQFPIPVAFAVSALLTVAFGFLTKYLIGLLVKYVKYVTRGYRRLIDKKVGAH